MWYVVDDLAVLVILSRWQNIRGSGDVRIGAFEIVGLVLGVKVAMNGQKLEDHAVFRALLSHRDRIRILVVLRRGLAIGIFDALAKLAAHQDDDMTAREIAKAEFGPVPNDALLGSDTLKSFVLHNPSRAVNLPYFIAVDRVLRHELHNGFRRLSHFLHSCSTTCAPLKLRQLCCPPAFQGTGDSGSRSLDCRNGDKHSGFR